MKNDINATVIDAEECYWEVYTSLTNWCPYCNLHKVGGGSFSYNATSVLLNCFTCNGCNRKITWIHERRLRFS